MRLNSEASIKRARKALHAYGGWANMLSAASVNENGRLIIPEIPINDSEKPKAKRKSARK